MGAVTNSGGLSRSVNGRFAVAGLLAMAYMSAVAFAAPAGSELVKLPPPAEGKVNLVVIETTGKPRLRLTGLASDALALTQSGKPKNGKVRTLVLVANRRPATGGKSIKIGLGGRTLASPSKAVVNALGKLEAARRLACASAISSGKLKLAADSGLGTDPGKVIATALLKVICGAATDFDRFLVAIAGIDITFSGGGGGGGPTPTPPDTTAPTAPALTGTSPASPANDTSPEIIGTAEASSTVRLYATSNCSGTVAAEGPAATLASPGLTVTVIDGSTTSFSATATDNAGNVSPCSNSISYIEQSGGSLGTPTGHVVYRIHNNPAVGGQPANAIYRVATTANSTPQNLSAALNALSDPASPGIDDFSVNLSPDGQWLVIDSNRFDSDCEPPGGFSCLAVIQVNPATGALIAGDDINVVDTPGNLAGTPAEFDQKIHPDPGFAAIASGGNRVVFAASEGPNVRDLWVVNRVGGVWKAPTILTSGSTDPHNYQPAISEAGDEALFNCAQGTDPQSSEHAICKVNLTGTPVVTEVVNGSARPEPHQSGIPGLHHADYLANGAGIAFESTWLSQQSIWTLATGATVPQKLPGAGTDDVAPCVIPSGHIAHLDLTRPGNPSGFHELIISDLTTTNNILPIPLVDVFDVGYGCGV